MPAIAVAGAAWGGAALAAGGLTVFGTIAAIGAVAAGVGVVTKSKDLIKIGAVMGLVGGVGALAQSAGALSAPGEMVAAEAMGGGVSEAAVSGAATARGAVAKDVMRNVVPVGDMAATSGGTAAAAPAAQVGAPAGAAGRLVNTPAVPPPAPSIFTAVKDFAKPMVQWAEKNQMLTYGMMQVGGGAIQGLFDTTKDSTNAALDARAEIDRRRAENLAAPVPTATAGARRDVYGNTPRPTYNAPVVPGLLNSITGRPS